MSYHYLPKRPEFSFDPIVLDGETFEEIFEGAACLIGISIAGAIFDAIDSYIIPFYIVAVFFIFASLFGFVAHKIHIEQKQAAAAANQSRT